MLNKSHLSTDISCKFPASLHHNSSTNDNNKTLNSPKSIYSLHTVNNTHHATPASIRNLPVNTVNRVLEYLNWCDVLQFGATNRGHLELVRRFIDQHQQLHGAIIRFEFVRANMTTEAWASLGQIFQLYGPQLRHVAVYFGQSLDMTVLFGAWGGNSLPYVQRLHLNVFICEEDFVGGAGGSGGGSSADNLANEDDEHDDDDIEAMFGRYDVIFEQSMTDIVNRLNANALPSLQRLNFNFSVELSPIGFGHYARFSDRLCRLMNVFRPILLTTDHQRHTTLTPITLLNFDRFAVYFTVRFDF